MSGRSLGNFHQTFVNLQPISEGCSGYAPGCLHHCHTDIISSHVRNIQISDLKIKKAMPHKCMSKRLRIFFPNVFWIILRVLAGILTYFLYNNTLQLP